MSKHHLLQYTLQLADNVLILGQRLGEWCGHGPILEQDIALTNISLDLIGQSRLLYQYAAELRGDHATEDTMAYLRTEREYLNVLLVEQPNGNFADTMMRQFLFDVFNYINYEALTQSADERLAAIASKSLKEVRYHLRFSSEWVIRMGDGTEVSRKKIQNASEALWQYTDELHTPSAHEAELIGLNIAPDWRELSNSWHDKVQKIMAEATVPIPEVKGMQMGGKNGIHTEHMGYILTELQYMQRTYPEAQW